MIRLLLAALTGAVVAALCAWRLGGSLGNGVLVGFSLGAAVSGLGCLYQRHVLLTRPDRVMLSVAASFLVKLFLLLAGGLVFRFVEVVAVRADWRSFLVAFAAAAALLVPLGALDAARAYQRSLVAARKA